MSLDTIMNMSITVESRAPSQAGFGTPLLFGYHTAWIDQLVKLYATADEMLDDGFTADDDLYKAAREVKSQNPSPDVFKIGRRVAPLTQVVTLTPLNTTEGFKYKGTIGGKSLIYTVLAGATTLTVAAALIAAINALNAGTTATGDAAAAVLGTIAGPWALVTGDTLKISIDTEVPGSPETVTFTGAAAARETTNTSATPFALADADVLNVKIDRGTAQAIVFNTASFVDITNATAPEVAAVINGQIVGAKATVTNTNHVTITSDTKGLASHVEVTGGTANAAGKLNFATAEVNGTGNVNTLAGVTLNEVKAAVEAIVTDCVVTNSNGYLLISSLTTGPSSKVNVSASGSAQTKVGLDTAVHVGTTGAGVVTCTANSAGKVVSFDFSTMKRTYLQVKDVTADTTTDDELPLINEEDSDWYGLLVVDSSSKATALNTAAWVESQRKLCVLQTGDTEVLNSDVTDDTMSALKDSSYARTGCIFHLPIGGVEWLAAGWLAGALTTTPGSATMAFEEVPGVKVDLLLPGEEASILAKNGSHYTNTGGLGTPFEGKSGSGAFMDTTRFIDWVYARMRETVLGVLSNNLKIPFTDAGVDILRLAIMSIIQLGINAGGFASTPPPTVTAPLVKDVPATDRINRILPDLSWTAQLAGAIHRLTPVRGTVSV